MPVCLYPTFPSRRPTRRSLSLENATCPDSERYPFLKELISLDQILFQPFTATDNPRVLGFETIPNITEKISAMIEKYRKETIDIEDVEFEEVDLEFDTLFPDKLDNSSNQDEDNPCNYS